MALFATRSGQPLGNAPLKVVTRLPERTVDEADMPTLGLQLELGAGRQLTGFGQAVRKHERVVSSLDDQGWCADFTEEIATRGAAIVILGVRETIQRRGDPAIEIPERAHVFQRADRGQFSQALV